jgi:hypothetical protein
MSQQQQHQKFDVTTELAGMPWPDVVATLCEFFIARVRSEKTINDCALQLAQRSGLFQDPYALAGKPDAAVKDLVRQMREARDRVAEFQRQSLERSNVFSAWSSGHPVYDRLVTALLPPYQTQLLENIAWNHAAAVRHLVLRAYDEQFVYPTMPFDRIFWDQVAAEDDAAPLFPSDAVMPYPDAIYGNVPAHLRDGKIRQSVEKSDDAEWMLGLKFYNVLYDSIARNMKLYDAEKGGGSPFSALGARISGIDLAGLPFGSARLLSVLWSAYAKGIDEQDGEKAMLALADLGKELAEAYDVLRNMRDQADSAAPKRPDLEAFASSQYDDLWDALRRAKGAEDDAQKHDWALEMAERKAAQISPVSAHEKIMESIDETFSDGNFALSRLASLDLAMKNLAQNPFASQNIPGEEEEATNVAVDPQAWADYAAENDVQQQPQQQQEEEEDLPAHEPAESVPADQHHAQVEAAKPVDDEGDLPPALSEHYDDDDDDDDNGSAGGGEGDEYAQDYEQQFSAEEGNQQQPPAEYEPLYPQPGEDLELHESEHQPRQQVQEAEEQEQESAAEEHQPQQQEQEPEPAVDPVAEALDNGAAQLGSFLGDIPARLSNLLDDESAPVWDVYRALVDSRIDAAGAAEPVDNVVKLVFLVQQPFLRGEA